MIDQNPTSLLARVVDPSDLRRLSEDALPAFAEQLRSELLQSVSRSGGHLSAGLGTVELAIALHYVYDTPRDALVWDVGHQAYPHKMLTGRRDRLASIRQREGLSGFLRRDESPYDAFGAGHSSTSIGAALGIAVAESLASESPAKAVAIIGDGALTAGMAFEALHHAGGMQADLLVILNDNGMSISENVGALAKSLGFAESGQSLTGFFNTLGFAYEGPVDGHDLPSLVGILKRMRGLSGPRLLHLRTRKGAGYERAEAEPIRYHGVTPFNPAEGLVSRPSPVTYTQVFGDWLCEMAAHDSKLVVITPAMREGSGLNAFAKRFPERFFDVGIAEQHAVTFAAGLATRGLRPVVAIYSTFLQRAFDQLVHDVCLQGLPVTFAIDRAGLVGPDGATHNGSLDLSSLRSVPGITVMTPADAQQLRAMLRTGIESGMPAAIRYPRCAALGVTPAATALVPGMLSATLPPALPIGRGHIERHGSGIALLCFGSLLKEARELSEIIDATVIDMRFVKPLDEDLLRDIANSHELLVSIEENVIAGGAGSAVGEALQRWGHPAHLLQIGLPDRAIEHGTREQCLQEAGLDVPGIFDTIARYTATLESSSATLRPRQSAVNRNQLSLSRNTMFNGVTRSLTRFRMR
ncbi:MAG: 1-deoxy-D-xylulose-5-phosphate synthase [Gammaproteobacteria bacterium]|jgi:1-deoxy-D-xylulose-5-phosphate synthase|nr:1-deoxy-D-xylulose-5-phosphate synthase [Gammaproteobacteria bacterium]